MTVGQSPARAAVVRELRPGVHGHVPHEMPTLAESVDYVRRLGKPSVVEVLRRTHGAGRVAIQPRCGVGGHEAMRTLLTTLDADAGPDLLTITIDSHTRLKRFDAALRALNSHPADLNGYPLVSHGWQRGRDLNESVPRPLEIRHGSPDARLLFQVAVASGITSFEGGGISYNLPYSKDVPIAESLAAWREVDAWCGELARMGLVIDRELFGTLTAVLVPASISLATGLIEASLAAREGVRCVSVSYPQGGNVAQDVAALRAIPILAARYLPADVEVFPVLHEFMGVFPRDRRHANELIFFGALVARLGGAAKVVTKTPQEAHGVPDAAANVEGLRTARMADSPLLSFVSVDEAAVYEELAWLIREVTEIVDPVLEATDPYAAVVRAFQGGTLDIPFSASRHARSAVIPRRDHTGAIRYLDPGGLPLSRAVVDRHRELLDLGEGPDFGRLMADLTGDINYFPEMFGETPARGADLG